MKIYQKQAIIYYNIQYSWLSIDELDLLIVQNYHILLGRIRSIHVLLD